MHNGKTQYRYFSICLLLLVILSCNNKNDNEKDENIITDPKTMDSRVADNISKAIKNAINNSGKIDDSTLIDLPQMVKFFYSGIDYKPVWSSTKEWLPMADSLFQFIAHAENEGLFPNDYHYKSLRILKDTLDADSLSRMNAALWTKADLLLTDGFMHIIKDLKQGRLHTDSLSLNKDSMPAKVLEFHCADFVRGRIRRLLAENV